MKPVLSLLLLLISIVFLGCGDLGTEYGVLAIQSPKGKSLYFRREVRSANYDALSLSETLDYCLKPDSKTSIIFTSLDHTVFYKFTGDELHIYTMSSIDSPPVFSKEVTIVLHKLTNQQLIEMLKNYKESELQLVDVPINKNLWCIF